MLLVTGVTGLTGRFLLGELRWAGYSGRIRCLVRAQSDVAWIDDEQVELFRGDVSEVASLREALAGVVDGVIHVAHIHDSRQVAQACLEQGVARVIYISILLVFTVSSKPLLLFTRNWKARFWKADWITPSSGRR